MRWYGKLLGFIAGALLFRPNPLFGAVAAVSVGVYKGQPVLDLDYPEDSDCDTEDGL